MTTQKPVRRDWTLLIFIIPLAVILILVVGQWAIRLVPFWSLNVGMNSNLEPDAGSARPFALLEPILPQILIPLPWAETYLLPGEDGVVSFPPFLQFIPIAAPSSTPDTPAATETTPTETAAVPSETPSPTSAATGKVPTDNNTGNGEGAGGGGGTPPTEPPSNNTLGCTNPNALNYNPSATVDNGLCIPKVLGCTDPAAFNYNSSANIDNGSCVSKVLGCTDPAAFNYNSSANIDNGSCVPKVLGCTDQAASNYNSNANVDDGSCVFPPATCQDPNAPNYGLPSACNAGTVSTPETGVSHDTIPDNEINVGSAPDNLNPNNSNNIGTILDGYYIVLSLQIEVKEIPDNFYDLVYYEFNNGGSVYLDLIIIGITNDSTGSTYYEVFNWGNGAPDMNTNVGDVAVVEGGEDGDQEIPVSDDNLVPPSPDTLYDPDYDAVNGTNGEMEQTGILIDVDNAGSDPPPGTYQFVVIISPPNTGSGDGGNAQVDAIQAVEVPIPTP